MRSVHLWHLTRCRACGNWLSLRFGSWWRRHQCWWWRYRGWCARRHGWHRDRWLNGTWSRWQNRWADARACSLNHGHGGFTIRDQCFARGERHVGCSAARHGSSHAVTVIVFVMFAKEPCEESLVLLVLRGGRARIRWRIGLSVIFATKPLATGGTEGPESK